MWGVHVCYINQSSYSPSSFGLWLVVFAFGLDEASLYVVDYLWRDGFKKGFVSGIGR